MRRTHQTELAISLMLAIVMIATLPPGTDSASAAASSSLSVRLSGNVLTASRNNTLSIEIVNAGGYLRELDLALGIPPPLILFGDNHWIRSSFAPKEAILANLTLFAPASAAGAALQGSLVAVYKAIGETVPTTETHAISLLVRGWIDLKVYEITVDPNPVLPGGEITVSGNVLNRGVIAAMYTNVSLAAVLPLLSDSVKPTYVGEVDPNAPAPFSVTVIVDPNTVPGNYQATIVVYYRDDLQIDQTIRAPIEFSVVSELPKTESPPPSIVSQLLSNQLILLGAVLVIVLVIAGAYLNRRSKGKEP